MPPPPLPWTWILLVKDSPLEHPFLTLGYKCCTDIDIVNILRSWCKCMSASPENRFSDILFVREDLILRKPEKERSAAAELPGSVHPIT